MNVIILLGLINLILLFSCAQISGNNNSQAHRKWLYASGNALINGRNNSVIQCGDSIRLDYTFSPGRMKALLSVFIDSNDNGVLDDKDYKYGEPLTFVDGDFDDLDKKVNSHYSTIVTHILGKNIPVNCIMGRKIFFLINDGLTQAIATLNIKATAKSFVLTGIVANPRNLKNLAVILRSNSCVKQNAFLTFSDKDGCFQFYLPESSDDQQYIVTSEDYFNLLNDSYFPPPPVIIDSSDLIKSIILCYTIKTSFICGKLLDEDKDPVKGIKVYASSITPSEDSRSFSSTTDSSGYFRIGVAPGLYKISFNAENLFPRYMYPNEPAPVNVLEGQTISNINIQVLKTNEIIRCHVDLEGKASKNIYIAAWNENGSIWQKTDINGNLDLKVNKTFKYHIEVNPDNVPSGYFQSNSTHDMIKSEANINFNFIKASVKLEGIVKDSITGEPLHGIQVVCTNGDQTYFTRTDENGYYSILGASGRYYLMANDEQLSFNQIDTSVIANTGYYKIDFQLGHNIIKPDIKTNIDKDLSLYSQTYQQASHKGNMIKYILPKFSHVTLKIYDISGKELTTLEDKTKSPGVYEINLDHLRFISGIYIYKLKAGQIYKTKKFLIDR
ncbi:MAG: carboxypeptidase regulatory-like domain-containing protein [Bacteroidota bacterium]|nr:carboxypeptidase regulatory-like domain-containing protein [Bacteroidota bacterium]